MKTGLVLEGGAMRGMFTAGVLDVLMENGITVDGAIGVSAGAVFGCNYKSHQIGRTIRYNTQYCNDRRYASFKNLLRTGNLYSEQFCYHGNVRQCQNLCKGPSPGWWFPRCGHRVRWDRLPRPRCGRPRHIRPLRSGSVPPPAPHWRWRPVLRLGSRGCGYGSGPPRSGSCWWHGG